MGKDAVIAILCGLVLLLALWNLRYGKALESKEPLSRPSKGRWLVLAMSVTVVGLVLVPVSHRGHLTELALVALCFGCWKLRQWQSMEETGSNLFREQVVWLALAFAVTAPALTILVTPFGDRKTELCTDDQHALASLTMLIRGGPWQHPELGRVEVGGEPFSVGYLGQRLPARLLMPSVDGVLALRWQAQSSLPEGVVLDEGELELVIECRPVQGFQVGPGAASLSFDLGESFSWWSSPDSS
jgi:hypothetical protein